MKRCLLLVLATAILIGCSGPTSTPMKADKADKYIAEYGGNRDVYTEILSLTDCKILQEKFDTASANNAREKPGTQQFKWTLGYMTVADDRMKAVGCYK